ncbi:uncharacterized protein THITE_2113735 [Thermothielavioides terrestris NRRL 8126]|uniref:Dopey N-terminal domain-containing protein n=1 Tax=Thermothielavioides terrestris (strain ATCC 38088 / NRRL 8126) TaxID=578455 RepID=G2R3W1_THETT|nr:uncharacterized protein THITE_2113735 [Thermothielavioides terrestris NRRL 8126]AEO66016.1 hypothetical protein THITE_2113735 [Thermothielavioides terrestris NRRL 8126]
MSLNRRLWSWLLGPEPLPSGEHDGGLDSPTSTSAHAPGILSSRTSYFEEYGLQPLIRALLAMIKADVGGNPAERARPYRICLSLMDRWEIGGLVVPELFLPVVESVREFKAKALSKADFAEVLRSASVFFDGVESGLIYGELLALMAQAIGPGDQSLADRRAKLDLVKFVLANFNVREEEMITIHAPLTVLSALCMLEEAANGSEKPNGASGSLDPSLSERVLNIIVSLLELVPERAFPRGSASQSAPAVESKISTALPNAELLKRIRTFYVAEQGSLEVTSPPFDPRTLAELLLQKACDLNCSSLGRETSGAETTLRSRVLTLLLSKVPEASPLDTGKLLATLHQCLSADTPIPFTTYSSILSLASHLYSAKRISTVEFSDLVVPLVRHAWVFLSASEPKYHVETVRSLWLLQSALTLSNRDVEAAICSLMLQHDTPGAFALRPADPGRSFCVLWTHTLQDNPSAAERRGPKATNGDVKAPPRLSGVEHYDVMLTRPVFLMLDALADERTQLFMAVKTWLNSLIGMDKLFGIFFSKFTELPFLRRRQESKSGSSQFIEEDDLSLALYYVRTLSSVLRWAPEAVWAVLAKRSIKSDACQPPLSEITGTDADITLQEFFLHVCLQCLAHNEIPGEEGAEARATQLHRATLTLLHQILLNPFADQLAKLHLENVLIEKLQQSLNGPDPYVQVLLLDVVFASLKLRELVPVEPPTSPTHEKRGGTLEAARSSRVSLTSERHTAAQLPPPPTLLKCILAGLSSPSSRPVLDSWVGFLTECLPLYAESVFQVLIPLVETLCGQVESTFNGLQRLFRATDRTNSHGAAGPETTLISLLNCLEQVLANGHDRLLAEEARAQVVKSPEQPQGFFGNMVSGVFSSEAPQTRSATANDRLTVLLAFQDAVRICFTIWSWGQGNDAAGQDATSAASLNYTALRMRNRARRLLEHLFAAETLECLETVVGIWRGALDSGDSSKAAEVFNLLPALDGSRPKHTIPALFNAIYSRTNPAALDPSRRSTLTIELQDTDLVIFLVDYTRSLEDDTMDEIWQDCTAFLKDLLGNPFPHRQTLPSLLEFAAILGEKVDNTNFGEQRKMRRELADLFLRLLTAIFTTRPASFDISGSSNVSEKRQSDSSRPTSALRLPAERADDVVGILSTIVPNLPKILVENDRILTAATAISTNVIGPALRSKSFPDTVSKTMLVLLHELSRLPNNQKSWKKDISDAFNDARFFGASVALVHTSWLPLLKQWTVTDKERMPDLLSRLTPPTTAGIVFGVGATSARLEADRKTQLNLRRIATLVLACGPDAFVADLPAIADKITELLAATATSSPSSTTRAEVYMLLRALVLRTSPVHLAPLWPVVNAELHAAVASVLAPDHSPAADTYANASVLQACKLLDLLVCVAPDEFQLHEWLFVTDTVDAVYRPQFGSGYQPVALVDEVSEELGAVAISASHAQNVVVEQAVVQTAGGSSPSSAARRRPLLGSPGGISDEVSLERRDELVAKVLRPFFGQLSIYAFEATYAMAPVDWEGCVAGLVKDLFDEKSIVKAL